MRSFVCFVLFLALAVVVVPIEAADSSCLAISREIVGKTFVTKEPLYDTVIGYNGIIKLERDKKEIRAGATCRVKDVDCGGSKVEVTLKQVAGAKEFNKVEIKFRISKHERNAPEGMDDFRKMLAFVLEEPESEDDSTE